MAENTAKDGRCSFVSTRSTVHVNTQSKEYDVFIDSGLLSRCGEMLLQVYGGDGSKKTLIVTDDIVNGLYGSRVEESLRQSGYNVSRFVFPNGEGSKNINTYIALLNKLASENLTRSDLVVALGGGVVGDLSGFAAATYLRGIGFVQIPTTLLAMVDSSVGGKTAVNLECGKNQVGAFYQPDVVLCDYDTLSTLTEEVFRDGCAEVIKHAVIRDADLFERLKDPLLPQIEDIIARNVAIKRDVVTFDETDLGIRQILNFGHTIAHGIEKHSDYTITHGSAVAIGMVLESHGDVRSRIVEMLKRYGLPYELPESITTANLIEAAFADKKRTSHGITLPVCEEIGTCELRGYDMNEIQKMFKNT